jgi:hypothetical protein
LQDADLVINYDIHWNPVRLIQRMGRIDRIGSPNPKVHGVNFWPGNGFESVLKLKKRVEDRMSIMLFMGSEVNKDLLKKHLETNPLLGEQAQRQLEKLGNQNASWDDIEVSEDILGLDDLSMEQFRQDLLLYLEQNEKEFKEMPPGIYSGFKALEMKDKNGRPIIVRPGVVALLLEKANGKKHLIYQNDQGSGIFLSHFQVLLMLKHHIKQKRFVPKAVEVAAPDALQTYADWIEKWLRKQSLVEAGTIIDDLFGNGVTQKNEIHDQTLEARFQKENFSLLLWECVSG